MNVLGVEHANWDQVLRNAATQSAGDERGEVATNERRGASAHVADEVDASSFDRDTLVRRPQPISEGILGFPLEGGTTLLVCLECSG